MGQKDPTKSIDRSTGRENVTPERYRNITSQKDLTEASSQGNPEELGPYEIFVTSPQLKRGVGTGLIDIGAQVSLAKGSSLERNIPKGKYREINVSVQGINEGDMHIKKGIMMQVNNSKEMFYIVERLPRNLDVILGQEWLFQNDYMMTCPKVILPFSENIVKVPTKERGVRLVDKQELLLGYTAALV
jgi:uncharacterized secreted protein with C-terminal beta-propeller domain